ncbi:outer membrane protein assembly factor BamB family protein [Streptomyces collinus]|uniref:outer membrane protein assembly factor BamB family protein n=1 Tax=Streptomyces collinus TaxID=42684 RepID=UPI0037D3D55B
MDGRDEGRPGPARPGRRQPGAGRRVLARQGPDPARPLLAPAHRRAGPAKQAEASGAHLRRGTVYFTRGSGGVSAVSPRTGRTLWDSNSTVEQQGPPAASATHVYFASPTGRVAALNVSTGKIEGTSAGRDDSGEPDNTSGAPLTLVGDALYVPYGDRSVYTPDVRTL